jgi:hypothetical protein
MRLSEHITIYLAAGASFGVSRYLLAMGHAKRQGRAIAEGIAGALLWPLLAAAILVKHLRHVTENGRMAESDQGVYARTEVAKRHFVISVNNMLEAARALCVTGREAMEQTLYAVREGAEQYVALVAMEADADEFAAPAAHEAELARVSGRRGDDLRVAALCVHRRNVARIRAHYQRERSRLLGKLAELQAGEDNPLSSEPDRTLRAERRRISEARLDIYLRAIDLFSLAEDERAVRRAAQMMDAECFYLRRLREADEAADMHASGEERCKDHARQLVYKDPLRATTLTQG